MAASNTAVARGVPRLSPVASLSAIRFTSPGLTSTELAVQGVQAMPVKAAVFSGP